MERGDSRDEEPALYALDAATGEQQWVFNPTIGGSPQTGMPLLVVDGVVYAGIGGTGESTESGRLYAIDAVSGQRQWTFRTGSSVASATVVDGTVYVGELGSEDNNGSDSALHAVDAASRESQWEFSETVGFLNQPPMVVDGTAYVVSSGLGQDQPESALYAVDAESGEKLWSHTRRANFFSSPVVVDGTAYLKAIGVDSENRETAAVYAIDAATGDQEWALDDFISVLISAPTVAQGLVYIGTTGEFDSAPGGENGGLYAIDGETGDPVWSFNRPWISTAPTFANGIVYAGGAVDTEFGDETLYAVSGRNGDELWQFTPQSGAITTPTVADGTLYIGTEGTFDDEATDAALYAIDAATGDQEWAFTNPQSAAGTPTVVGDPRTGNSIDSLTLQGTFDHHGSWWYSGQRIDVVPESSSEPPANSVRNAESGLVTLPRLAAVGGGGMLALLGGYVLKRHIGHTPEEPDTTETAVEKPQRSTVAVTADNDAVAKETADRLATARTHLTYAKRAHESGEQERARRACERAIETAEETGSPESAPGVESLLREARTLQETIENRR